MASINRPELRFAYRVFITVNILLAVYNMICFQLPRSDIKPCVLVIANLSQQGADAEPKLPPLQAVAATNFVKPQFQNRQPLQSKQSTARPVPVKVSGASLPASVTAVAGGGKFEIYGDFIVADESVPFNESVTLTTQATHEFLQHAPTLCNHWQGPVSVAAYSPGTDYEIVLNKIAYLRQCGDPCVRANMTWHIVYDRAHRPAHLQNATEFLASWNGSCSSDVMTREYAEYRKAHKMTYPINVLRNAARTRARTMYVLASDIELYPSGNIIPRFMRLLKQPNLTRPRQVFILPIFEVQAKQTAPLTKATLVKMMRNKTAIFFHKWVCEQCQKFPKRDEWVLYVPDEDKLGILTTTKRDKTKRSWEPIYIGTNDDPLYPEELTWEGKRDKMAQSYELCLKGYDFHILDNAFLVHAPGIKTIIAKEERRRVPFVKVNNAHHARLMNSLKAKYPKLAKDC